MFVPYRYDHLTSTGQLWLRIVSYLAIITSREVIRAEALLFKMAVLRFVNVFRGSDKRNSKKLKFEEHKRCY